MESRPTRKGLMAIDAALTLLGILLIVQMWLLTATLESYLAGHHDVVMPGLAASGPRVGPPRACAAGSAGRCERRFETTYRTEWS